MSPAPRRGAAGVAACDAATSGAAGGHARKAEAGHDRGAEAGLARKAAAGQARDEAPRGAVFAPHEAATGDAAAGLPAWLVASEPYEPPRDHDGFLVRSALSLTGVLARLRLDDGQPLAISPSAPAKLLLCLALVLLTSLSSNYAFVIVMLACTLVREALLPARALRRCMAASLAAAGLTLALMAPAALMGQGASAVLVGTKVLVCVGLVMTAALSTPAGELGAALVSLHVPDAFVQTVELALKGIADLGRTALSVLEALGLRSVGRNRDKGASLGGVMGVTSLKAGVAALLTADAMRCRGFEGSYAPRPRQPRRAVDALWAVAGLLVLALFAYLEGAA